MSFTTSRSAEGTARDLSINKGQLADLAIDFLVGDNILFLVHQSFEVDILQAGEFCLECFDFCFRAILLLLGAALFDGHDVGADKPLDIVKKVSFQLCLEYSSTEMASAGRAFMNMMVASILISTVLAVLIGSAFAAAHSIAAFRATNQAREDINSAGDGRLCIMRKDFLHTEEHIMRNRGRNIVMDAVHLTDVNAIPHRPFHLLISKIQPEFFVRSCTNRLKSF